MGAYMHLSVQTHGGAPKSFLGETPDNTESAANAVNADNVDNTCSATVQSMQTAQTVQTMHYSTAAADTF